MDFELTSEQTMLVDGAARFVREHYSLTQRRKVIASGGMDEHNWTRLAELGWLMLPLPEEAGGLGGPAEDVALLLIELGRGMVLEPFVTTVLLCGTILAGAVDPGVRSEVERIAAGELRVALAHDEGAASLAPGALPAAAARREREGFHISGTKRAVLDAPSAHKLIVSAALDGATALFLVDANTAGVVRNDYALIDGTRAAEVEFDNVAVDTAALIASGDTAVALLGEALDQANLGNLAQSVGGIEAILDICSEYLKTRQQFGRPIGSFQALQHIMAQMFVEAQEARSILYFAVAAMRGAPAVRTRAIAQARTMIGGAAQLVSRPGIQLHGGYGMTEEFAVGNHFKRLLTLEKMFGDSETYLDRLADALVA
jgi:alkylation response protein AidB-like acyl-CoA dehydrogenase